MTNLNELKIQKIIKTENIPDIIKVLQEGSKTQISEVLDGVNFTKLTVETNENIGKEIQELAEQFRIKLTNVLIPKQHPEERQRLIDILSDLFTLPNKIGNACPTDKQLSILHETLDKSSETFSNIATSLFEKEEVQSASDFYNDYSSYNADNAEIIKVAITSDKDLMKEIEKIQKILVDYIDGYTDEKALNTIFDKITGKPNSDVNSKTEAQILISEIKNKITKFVIEEMRTAVTEKKLPLIRNGNSIEDVKQFDISLKLASNFEELDRKAYIHMIGNDLGQAQTADPSRADLYFRSRESIKDKEIQNNFGYVYLNEKQAKELGIKIEENTVFPFTYFNEPYVAIPVGLYFSKINSEKYEESINGLKELADENINTPIEDYYKSLIKYYEFGNTDSNKANDDFIEGYYNACYESEQAWVKYIKYANQEKLPYVHIHPFENYGTASTKTHDLSLAFADHDETSSYLEGGDNFVKNAESFFKESGLETNHPKMIEETIKLLKSVSFISLSARLYSGLKGTIAQNIPNEEEGRKKGMITMFDTEYAKAALRTGYTNLMDNMDPIGDLSSKYREDINNDKLFMLHYTLEILAHELNHNSFRGKEQNYNGDNKGLSVKSIEEAKATNGVALNFKDPHNLNNEEMANLQSVIHLMLPWSIFRMRSTHRTNHSSDEYFREGAVLLDHLLKSGILELVGVKLDKNGNHQYLENDDFDLGDFEFLRVNKSKVALQNFVNRCANFTKDIGELYSKSQGFQGNLEEGTEISDYTRCDFYQIISKLCHEEEIDKKKKDGKNTKSTEASMAKLVDPNNELLSKKAEAIVRLVDNKEPKLLKETVKTVYNLTNKSEIDNKIAEIQQSILEKYPAIYE